jgi:hypothetical protein
VRTRFSSVILLVKTFSDITSKKLSVINISNKINLLISVCLVPGVWSHAAPGLPAGGTSGTSPHQNLSKQANNTGCICSSPMRVWSRCWAPDIRCVRRPSSVRLSLRPPAVGVTQLSCVRPASGGCAPLGISKKQYTLKTLRRQLPE